MTGKLTTLFDRIAAAARRMAGNTQVAILFANDHPDDLTNERENLTWEQVRCKTRILDANRAVALKDLKEYVNRNVSIRFVPERRGDVARTIRIAG